MYKSLISVLAVIAIVVTCSQTVIAQIPLGPILFRPPSPQRPVTVPFVWRPKTILKVGPLRLVGSQFSRVPGQSGYSPTWVRPQVTFWNFSPIISARKDKYNGYSFKIGFKKVF